MSLIFVTLFFSSFFHSPLPFFRFTKFKKYLSFQSEKFVAESFFSSPSNLHGCTQQPPSPAHHHLRCYLVWLFPLFRLLSFFLFSQVFCLHDDTTAVGSTSHHCRHLKILSIALLQIITGLDVLLSTHVPQVPPQRNWKLITHS